MTRRSSVLLAIATTALAPIQNANARTDRYEVVIEAESTGNLTVDWESEADVLVHYQYSNDGRTTQLVERYTLDADRHIVAQQVSGRAATGAAIDESYAWDGGIAEWRIGDRREHLEFDQAPAFVATACSPWWSARTVRALIDQRRSIPAVPEGQLSTERLRDVSLEYEGVRVQGTLYVLTGHAPRPEYVILDARGEFIAAPGVDIVIVPQGASALFNDLRLLAVQAELSARHLGWNLPSAR